MTKPTPSAWTVSVARSPSADRTRGGDNTSIPIRKRVPIAIRHQSPDRHARRGHAVQRQHDGFDLAPWTDRPSPAVLQSRQGGAQFSKVVVEINGFAQSDTEQAVVDGADGKSR
jgi:hypothetical protein